MIVRKSESSSTIRIRSRTGGLAGFACIVSSCSAYGEPSPRLGRMRPTSMADHLLPVHRQQVADGAIRCGEVGLRNLLEVGRRHRVDGLTKRIRPGELMQPATSSPHKQHDAIHVTSWADSACCIRTVPDSVGDSHVAAPHRVYRICKRFFRATAPGVTCAFFRPTTAIGPLCWAHQGAFSDSSVTRSKVRPQTS